jgi:hypothetical protein
VQKLQRVIKTGAWLQDTLATERQRRRSAQMPAIHLEEVQQAQESGSCRPPPDVTNKDNVWLVGIDEGDNFQDRYTPTTGSCLTAATMRVVRISDDTRQVLATNRLARFLAGWLLTNS